MHDNTLILASTSPYRRALLQRLRLPFTTAKPEVDETPFSNEQAVALVQRLAHAKAQAVAKEHPQSWVIGSDQCAVLDHTIIGKPGDHAHAFAQLKAASGRCVSFHTGLCLMNQALGFVRTVEVPFSVHFRPLRDAEIEHYLHAEQPYDCAGSFKSEGLGVALFASMQGDDPTSLIGLPLIALCNLLREAGMDPLG